MRDREIERERERERESEREHTSTKKPGLTSLSILCLNMAASLWTPLAKKFASLWDIICRGMRKRGRRWRERGRRVR